MDGRETDAAGQLKEPVERTISLMPSPSGLFTMFERILTSIVIELQDGESLTRARKRAIRTQLMVVRDELEKYPKLFTNMDWDDMNSIPDIFKGKERKMYAKGEVVLAKGWNVDDVLAYLKRNCPDVEQDNEQQILLYTGLVEDGEGNLRIMDDD